MAITADMTNSQLQILSVVATIFLPATLIAGIFGMNVKGYDVSIPSWQGWHRGVQ
jgi:Mg2+ and Co2+ transporter CorA